MADPLKLTISPTAKMVEVNGVGCRVWQGTTEGGVDVFLFVAVVGTDQNADPTEFEQSIVQNVAPPTAKVQMLPFAINMN